MHGSSHVTLPDDRRSPPASEVTFNCLVYQRPYAVQASLARLLAATWTARPSTPRTLAPHSPGVILPMRRPSQFTVLILNYTTRPIPYSTMLLR